MAFTNDQVQGVFGEFKPVLDNSVNLSSNQVLGVFGEFKPVLEESSAPPPTTAIKDLIGMGIIAFER